MLLALTPKKPLKGIFEHGSDDVAAEEGRSVDQGQGFDFFEGSLGSFFHGSL